MNLLFWKHKKEGHVIKQDCLNKLPITQHSYYEQTEDEPTHYYDDSTSLITGIMVGEMMADSGSSIPQSDDSNSFSGFGGGDFGGGGSSGSFDTPDNSSSYDDSSSSYDSGSSDSGSYDSGSSDSY
jgi:hypothetical protein